MIAPFIGTINIHRVTSDNTTCTIKVLDHSTCITITVGDTDINLYVDSDDLVSIKSILGS